MPTADLCVADKPEPTERMVLSKLRSEDGRGDRMRYETEWERGILQALLDIKDIKRRLVEVEDTLMHELTMRPMDNDTYSTGHNEDIG